MNIVDFCNKYALNYQPVELKFGVNDNGKPTKVIDTNTCVAKQNDFRNPNISKTILEDRKNLITDYIAIHTDKNIGVIDVDFEDGVEYSKESIEWVEKMKEILPYKKSTTKTRGLHLYFVSKDNDHLTEYRNEDSPYKDIEILLGQWAWEKNDSLIYNIKDSIPEMKIPKFNICKEMEIEIKLSDTNETESEDLEGEGEEKILDENSDDPIISWISKIPTTQVDKYPEWFKTLCSIKKYGEEYKEAARELSNRSENRGGFDKTWGNIKIKDSKKPNTELENSVNSSKDFYDLFGKNIVVNNFDGKKETYIYDEKSCLWRRDDDYTLLKYNIGKLLDAKYREDISELSNPNTDKQKLNILLKNINNNSWRTDIAHLTIQTVLGNQYQNIEFDNIYHLYHFKNKTLDLKTLKFRKRCREDFVTMFGRHLDDRKEEKVEEWRKIIKSIFLDKDIRDTWINLMINSFSGKVLQKFIVLNGGGANGKSFIDDVFKHIHKDYYYKANCGDLCNQHKGGSNPSLANCNKKRFCVWSEPDEKNKLQVSVIKELTGEDSINARKNYSNDTNIKMCGIKLIECNKRLRLSGDTGYSVIRRFLDVLLSSTFKLENSLTENDEPYDEIENPEGYQLANPEYDSNEWKDENSSGLFWYLYDYMVDNKKNYFNMGDFKVAQKIVDRTQAYILDNNDFLSTVSMYIEPKKGAFIKIKDIKEAMEMDYDYYSLLSRFEKKNLTLPKLKKKFIEDPQLGSCFKPKHKKDGVQYYNVLLNYDLKSVAKEEDKKVMNEGLSSDSED